MNVQPERRKLRRHQLRYTLLACAVSLAIASPAYADAVTDWNLNTGTVISAAGGPPSQTRVYAMVQIAVHDALNAIDPRYKSYTNIGAFSPDASPEAAVARATRDVLIGQLPAAQDAIVAAMYNTYIGGLSCAPAPPTCIGDGEDAGAAAAAAMLEERLLDGSENPHRPYTLAVGPGVYQATLPAPAAGPLIQFGGWGEVEPFALGNASQFMPPREKMLDIRSKAYAAEYNEVKALGSFAVRNAAPDSEESRIARYWPGGGSNYNAITRAIVSGMARDLWDNAHLFALVNMAVADAAIATFHVKYKYNFWRPYTAIRWLDDGNPGTAPDLTFTSYITTPPYPDYTCGLPTLVGASTGMLREYFGTDEVPYSLAAVGLTRSYDTLSQASAEAASARVYGGIHFRTGCVRGVEQAEDVASFVFHTQLKPLQP